MMTSVEVPLPPLLQKCVAPPVAQEPGVSLAQMFYTSLKLSFPALKSPKTKTERSMVFLFLC